MKALPFAVNETEKTSLLLSCEDWDDIDAYADLYRPRLFIPLSGLCNRDQEVLFAYFVALSMHVRNCM